MTKSSLSIFTMVTGKHAGLCLCYHTLFKPEIPPSHGDLNTTFFLHSRCHVGHLQQVRKLLKKSSSLLQHEALLEPERPTYCRWRLKTLLPGGFLLQLRHTRHVEHDPEEEQRLVAKLVQLLLEGFLQLHPAMSRGLRLSVEPQPEVMGLEQRREMKGGSAGSRKFYVEKWIQVGDLMMR